MPPSRWGVSGLDAEDSGCTLSTESGLSLSPSGVAAATAVEVAPMTSGSSGSVCRTARIRSTARSVSPCISSTSTKCPSSPAPPRSVSSGRSSTAHQASMGSPRHSLIQATISSGRTCARGGRGGGHEHDNLRATAGVPRLVLLLPPPTPPREGEGGQRGDANARHWGEGQAHRVAMHALAVVGGAPDDAHAAVLMQGHDKPGLELWEEPPVARDDDRALRLQDDTLEPLELILTQSARAVCDGDDPVNVQEEHLHLRATEDGLTRVVPSRRRGLQKCITKFGQRG